MNARRRSSTLVVARLALAALSPLAPILGIAACVEEGGAGTGHPGGAADGGGGDASSSAPSGTAFDVASVTLVDYEEHNFGQHRPCGRLFYEELTFDLAAKTVRVRACDASDAGVSPDAGSSPDDGAPIDDTRALSDDAVATARSALEQLRVIERTEPCSGHDRIGRALTVTTPAETSIVSTEFVCSGGPVIDKIAEAGFLEARTALYELAGLAVPSRL